MSDKLKGGNADNRTLEDIAKKHNVPIADIEAEFQKGLDVEKEHSEDDQERAEIAKDHLWEAADYYTKLKQVENSLDKRGEIRYIRHCKAGLATYPDEVVLVQDDCLKQMMPSGVGIPVYIDHVNQVDMEKADGYVVESFYNQPDGCYWFKSIITDFDALMKIDNGYGASNAYLPKKMGGGGLYHGGKYDREVIDAEYTHLAIVKNPRYNESMILTTDEFKAYNEKLETELKELQNSLEEKEEKKEVDENAIKAYIMGIFKPIFNSDDKDADDKDKKIAELEEKLNAAMKKNEDYEAKKKAKEEEEKKNQEEEEKKKEEEEKKNSQFFNSLQKVAIERGGDDDKVKYVTREQRLEEGKKNFA